MTKKNRVPFNCLVKPETSDLIVGLQAHLDRSQGQVIDRAVQALAVAESFGGNHLRLDADDNPPLRDYVRPTVPFISDRARKRLERPAVAPPAGAKVGREMRPKGSKR